MNNKQKYIGIPTAIILSPIIVAGFIFQLLSRWFQAGMSVGEQLDDYLDDWFNND